MTEIQYDMYGKPVKLKPVRPKPDPAEMSAAAQEMLTKKPAAFAEPFYTMLDDVGIVLDRFQLQEMAESIRVVRDDYPIEWIDALGELIVERGVTNPQTVASYLVASSQRWIRPGDKPEAAKQTEIVRNITDAMWGRLKGVAQARDATALNRAVQHVLAIHETGPAEYPPQVMLCTLNSHAERGCSLVEYGIYKNGTVKVPDDTKEWARKYVTERPDA